jgi:hypothetical protein
VGLSAQARVPEMSFFFLFQGANELSSTPYFFGRKKKASDASLIGPVSDNPRVAINSGYWFFCKKTRFPTWFFFPKITRRHNIHFTKLIDGLKIT